MSNILEQDNQETTTENNITVSTAEDRKWVFPIIKQLKINH